MVDSLVFEDAGRTFTCTVQLQPAPLSEHWWWFTVSTDERSRYAPFRATKGDTAASVRSRIVAYYDELLARRAEPRATHWGRRGAAKGGGTATS